MGDENVVRLDKRFGGKGKGGAGAARYENPWVLDDGSDDELDEGVIRLRKPKYYSKTTFYTESRGEGGQQSMRVNVPHRLWYEISALVQSRAIPDFRTGQDFIRDAMVHRLYEVAEMLNSGEIIESLEVVLARDYWERMEQEETQVGLMLERMERLIRKAVERGDTKAAREMVSMAREQAETFGEFYQGVVERKMREFDDRLDGVDQGQEWTDGTDGNGK